MIQTDAKSLSPDLIGKNRYSVQKCQLLQGISDDLRRRARIKSHWLKCEWFMSFGRHPGISKQGNLPSYLQAAKKVQRLGTWQTVMSERVIIWAKRGSFR